MAKKYRKTKLGALIAMILGTFAFLAIGGGLVGGMFMDAVILKLLPLIVHQIVGWTMIAATLLSAVLAFMGK